MLLPQSYQYPNLWEGADRVGGQLRGDEECSFSGVTKSGRVWRKVPESDAGSVWSCVSAVRHGQVYSYTSIGRKHDEILCMKRFTVGHRCWRNRAFSLLLDFFHFCFFALVRTLFARCIFFILWHVFFGLVGVSSSWKPAVFSIRLYNKMIPCMFCLIDCTIKLFSACFV